MSHMKSLYEAVQDTKLRVEELEQTLDPIEPVIELHEMLKTIEKMTLDGMKAAMKRNSQPREEKSGIGFCEFCGKQNPDNGCWVGAKRVEDKGFTMVEGIGKLACDECYDKLEGR